MDLFARVGQEHQLVDIGVSSSVLCFEFYVDCCVAHHSQRDDHLAQPLAGHEVGVYNTKSRCYSDASEPRKREVQLLTVDKDCWRH